MKYVIVGNGVSAIGAIEGIRQFDKQGAILVVSDEKVPTYGRPLISYYLADKIKLETLPFRSQEWYEGNGVEMKLDSRVTKVDPQKKELVLTSGERLAYDKLLLATGGTPIAPNIPGVDGPGVHNFTTIAHAERLKELVDEVKSVVVIGAGLIALKAAEGFAEKGVPVTVVVRSRIMRAYFDECASGIVVKHLEKNGLHFLQGANTRAIVRRGDGSVEGVDTDKGFIPADVVVVAAGVRPSMALAEGSGIRTNKGIIVDDSLATSDPDVYAAGDVAEALDLLTGEYAVRPLWPNAYTQGNYAGINMAGEDRHYSGGLSMNSITYYGLPTVAVGKTNPLDEDDRYEIHSYKDEENEVYRKVVFEDDVLVGCILIGEIDHAGIYTSFIKNKFKLDAEAKKEIIDGTPSPVHWPEDYIQQMQNTP
ncbi:MAG: NAD(P)/FAD-dependent oxidoreductase [Desulfovibrionaceae bacterium]